MREELDRSEASVAEIAARQHGVVTVAQLYGAGIDKSGVTRRVRSGRLHRVHRGVYAVGHRGLSLHGCWMAAVLAFGEGAVLSHESAVVLWGFLKPLQGPIHVTSPSRSGKARRAGIVLHRSPSLRQGESVTIRERIPVTAPRRTIEDLEGMLPAYLVRRARRQAEFMKYRLDLPTDRSRSDLESDFLAFLRRHGLPKPEVNVKVGRWEVDFLWPRQRLAVETDFFDYHRGSQAFEDDHQRELDLRSRGYTVRRYTTGAQIRNYPDLVVADLREVLHGGP